MSNKEKCPCKKTSIGGQALIEGIMMRGPKFTAMAVRNPQKEIVIEKFPTETVSGSKITKLPLVRGIFAYIDSMKFGSKCLMRSAEISGLEEAEEELKKEKEEKRAKKAAKNPKKAEKYAKKSAIEAEKLEKKKAELEKIADKAEAKSEALLEKLNLSKEKLESDAENKALKTEVARNEKEYKKAKEEAEIAANTQAWPKSNMPELHAQIMSILKAKFPGRKIYRVSVMNDHWNVMYKGLVPERRVVQYWMEYDHKSGRRIAEEHYVCQYYNGNGYGKTQYQGQGSRYFWVAQ